MIKKIELKNSPDNYLVLDFIIRADSKTADQTLVDFAYFKMKERLEKQRDKGYTGWNTAQCDNANLLKRLHSNADSGDFVDVLNLAAMLLARNEMFKEHLLEVKE